MTDLEIANSIQAALVHHRAGRLAEAEKAYQQILASFPNQVDALHLLSVICGQTGRLPQGIALIRRACAARPDIAALFLHLGNLLLESRQSDGAIAAYQRAIQLDPASAGAYYNLGNVLLGRQQYAQAANAYRTALRNDPRLVAAHINLGIALGKLGNTVDAIAVLRQATQIDPNSTMAFDQLGTALRQAGQLAAALAAHRKAVELQPDSAAARRNLGNALKEAGALDEAIAAYQNVAALNPSDADALNTLGVALADRGRTHEAIAAYRSAVALQPSLAGAWSNLGVALAATGQFAEARTACESAVRADPANPGVHFNLGLILLKLGEFSRGWVEYEYRWKCPGLYKPRPFTQPLWEGGPLNGRTLLLHADQGLGDTIQFIRYVPMIAKTGGRIILACDAPLHNVLRDFPGIDALAADGFPPPCDVHCPVTSLPAVFRTTPESIPARVPYLQAIPELARVWREKLAPFDGRPKIGLVWAGRPSHFNDRNRSLSLEDLAPLSAANATFYSLQKGSAGVESANPPAGLPLVDYTADLLDWTDTAALIANLDLVISVDTSVAHLAGAMGKAVWTLLPLDPDWRWMLARDDTPWYPTMRLFRQGTPGNWGEVIECVRKELEAWVAEKPILRKGM